MSITAGSRLNFSVSSDASLQQTVCPHTIARFVRVRPVRHDQSWESAIRLQKARTNIEKTDVHVVLKFLRQQSVRLRNGSTYRVLRICPAREDTHQNNPALWSALVQLPAYFPEGDGNLLRRVFARMRTASQIVGSDLENNPLRAQPVELSLANSPKHVLSPVPTKTHVENGLSSEDMIPGFGSVDRMGKGRTCPEVCNGIPDHHNLRVQLLSDRELGMVACVPVIGIQFQPWNGNYRGVDFGHGGERHAWRIAHQHGQRRFDRFGHHAMPHCIRMQ